MEKGGGRKRSRGGRKGEELQPRQETPVHVSAENPSTRGNARTGNVPRWRSLCPGANFLPLAAPPLALQTPTPRLSNEAFHHRHCPPPPHTHTHPAINLSPAPYRRISYRPQPTTFSPRPLLPPPPRGFSFTSCQRGVTCAQQWQGAALGQRCGGSVSVTERGAAGQCLSQNAVRRVSVCHRTWCGGSVSVTEHGAAGQCLSVWSTGT